MEMTYAAIHGGGWESWNFPGFSPKVTYIFKPAQFIFPAKAFLARGIVLIHAINGMVNH